jgi:hypothetical protein
MSNCTPQQSRNVYLVFALLAAMLRPLRGSFSLWETLPLAARPQASDPIGECPFYLPPRFLRIGIFHLLNKMIDKDTASRDIPRGPWFPCDVDHEIGRRGSTSSCTVTCAFPVSFEFGNLTRLRCKAIGWVLLEEIVEFNPN